MRYPVNEVYLSIQGEGFMAGTPMVLLRLQGCDVGCPFCDSKYTWRLDEKRRADDADMLSPDKDDKETWALLETDQIVDLVREAATPQIQWVLITGGEPALYDLKELCDALHRAGYRVALETSGTASGMVGAHIDWVTVSPKPNMPGGKPLLADALSCADEIKYVICGERSVEELKTLLRTLDISDRIISVQPVSLSEKATQIAIGASLRYGWRLSIQLHKFIGLP